MAKFFTTPHWLEDERMELTTSIQHAHFDHTAPYKWRRRSYPHYLLLSFDTEYEAVHKVVREGNWRDAGDTVKEEHRKNTQRRYEGDLLNKVLCYSYSISCIRRPEEVWSWWQGDIREQLVWSYDGILYPKSYDIEDRFTVKGFISSVLTMCKEKWEGKYLLPKDMYIISHFTKADLPAFQEFKQEDEKYKLGLAALRNTFVSLKDRYTPSIETVDDPVELRVKFRDTYLLSPQAQRKLSDLGEMLGYKKIVLDEDYKKEKLIKENMTSFFENNLEKFEEYAKIDAVIARKYAEKIMIQQFNLTGLWNIPVTLTGIGIAKLDQLWEQDISLPDVLSIVGKEKHEEKIWSSKSNRLIKKKSEVFIDKVHWNQDFAIAGYHGGRNEQFQFGISDKEVWYDWDLESAYPTAMNLIGLPEWDKLEYLTSKDQVEGLKYTDLAIVAVNFKFKDDVRFPCLPTRSENGIIFPLEGYSVCGVQELKVAIDEGLLEEWELVHGVYVPSDKNNTIFSGYLNMCVAQRIKAKKGGDKFNDKFWKELVNSTYGKTAQGLRERKIFNLKDLETQPLPPSKFTNPFIAGFITSFVRATLAEVLNRLPPHIKVLNVITDGFLTNANEQDVLHAAEGHIGRLFTQSAIALGKEQAFGLKHRARQVLGFRTRGSATIEEYEELVEGEENTEFILQRGNIKLLDTYTKKQDNIAIVDLFLDRHGDQLIATTNAMGVRDMWLDGNDLTDKMTIKALSMEFDYKRKPINMRDVQFEWNEEKRSHITYETKPWRTLEEFQRLRTYLEEYNNYKRKVVKTLDDYRQMVSYVKGKEGSHKTSYIPNKTGVLGRLRQELCSAYYQYQGGMKQAHKIKAGQYAALLRDCGIDCMVKDVYNGKKRLFTMHNVPSTDEVIEALNKIRERIPELKVEDFTADYGEDVVLDDVDLTNPIQDNKGDKNDTSM
jgi:hypothetical protein